MVTSGKNNTWCITFILKKMSKSFKVWRSSAYVDTLTYWGGLTHISLQWHHNRHDDVSNHQPHHCLLKRLFRRRSKKTSKLHVTGLCAGNSPVTGEFPAQMASNMENVSIWWCHHDASVNWGHHWIRYRLGAKPPSAPMLDILSIKC